MPYTILPMPTQTTSSSTLTTAEIRAQFIEYFRDSHEHTFAPSSPVVPLNDPTLMFTNAGMNQFKDVFLAQGSRAYTRAVNTQKCIRAGGKHNDLEDVGHDTYHHTFFEMLGNWSFGDYFKAEAIQCAWDLLTNKWGLDKDRLYVTVFQGNADDGLEPDTESEELWKQYVPAERISRWGKKDNFWEMGDSGPCGPCSEIHYDNSPNGDHGHLVNKDDPRVIEIWNLVFIQFNRAPGSDGQPGKLTPLPAKHVDTGMGLERVARVMQGKDSNYDIDLFTPLFLDIEKQTGAHAYQGRMDDPVDIAYRVIADHIRCLTVAITDGARPSNDGRGYVLRRILRRAVRHAHQTLNTKGAWLHRLVPTVVETLGEAFPELKKNHKHVAEIIKDEEESFLTTLARGIELFEESATDAGRRFLDVERVARAQDKTAKQQLLDWQHQQKYDLGMTGTQYWEPRGFHWHEFPGKNRPSICAEDAFKLHDTYGFPIDLTRVMAEERGMSVDLIGYEALMEEARAASRKGVETSDQITLSPDAIAKLKHLNVQPTVDAPKYQTKPISAIVKAIWNGTDFDNHATIGRRVAVILERTNHYAEAGGQVGDIGEMLTPRNAGQIPARGFTGIKESGGATFKIEHTQNVGGYVLHIGRCTNDQLTVGEQVTVIVENTHREPVMANHTATHLLNFALRDVLGDEINQKGSLVAPDRLRFDFSHSHFMTADEIERVQQIVNDRIARHLQVHWGDMPLDRAMTITGVRAVFGEHYPDPVRVVAIGASIDDLAANPTREQWRQMSIEFCGGTHVRDANDIRHFVITHESALAAGVRRIIAITGPAAAAAEQAGINVLRQLEELDAMDGEQLVTQFDDLAKAVDDYEMSAIHRQRVHDRIEQLRKRVKGVRKQARAGAKDDVVNRARSIAEQAHGITIIECIDGADRDLLLTAMDVVHGKHPNTAVMLLSADEAEGKVMIAACVPKSLITRGLKAGDWVRHAAQACGGSGGGRPDMAQAGGKDPAKINDAIAAAHTYVDKALR